VIRDHLTTGQVAEIFQEPEWKVRRIVDSLDVEIPRAGLYRLVPRSMLTAIGEKLQKPQTVAKPRPQVPPAADSLVAAGGDHRPQQLTP
jgi:hypothetical protein